VLVDMHMKTSGLAVVRHYKRCYGPRVYCAVLSGADDDEVREACLEAGADEVFVKPIPASVLRRKLSEAVLALRTTAIRSAGTRPRSIASRAYESFGTITAAADSYEARSSARVRPSSGPRSGLPAHFVMASSGLTSCWS